MTKVADVVLPAAAWGEYTYTRENLERRLRVNQQFYDPPGRGARRVPDLRRDRPADSPQQHGCSTPRSGGSPLGGRLPAMQQTKEGKALGLDNITPRALRRSAPTGSSNRSSARATSCRHEAHLRGQVRHRRRQGALHRARPAWTDADPLAFLPEAIKPNAQYPFFVTTVRYQTVWQSGYTYRWTDRPRQHRSRTWSSSCNPADARKAGLKDGDWAELATSSRAARASSTSPTGASRGDVGHLRLAGAER